MEVPLFMVNFRQAVGWETARKNLWILGELHRHSTPNIKIQLSRGLGCLLQLNAYGSHICLVAPRRIDSIHQQPHHLKSAMNDGVHLVVS